MKKKTTKRKDPLCPDCKQKWNGKYCYTQGCSKRINKTQIVDEHAKRESALDRLRAQIRRLGKKPNA